MLPNQENDNEAEKGIPGFWLTIFKNTEILAEMTQPHDEPILEALRDINVSFPEKSMGFVLEFVFAENEFFEDKVCEIEIYTCITLRQCLDLVL